MYSFEELKKKIGEVEEWLKGEVRGIRTGRAAPALLDSIRVEAYGQQMPLNQVATVTTEDARTLRVSVWDADQVASVEKAITVADLGVSVGSDEKGVRVSFPELTHERREQLVKLVRSKLEEARVSLRKHREHVWNDIQKQEKDGELSEDEKFKAKELMQELIDKGNKALEAIVEAKEAELRQ